MKNHEGMKMPADQKDQKQNEAKAGSAAAPKKEDAGATQKTGHEGHKMPAKDAKK